MYVNTQRAADGFFRWVKWDLPSDAKNRKTRDGSALVYGAQRSPLGITSDASKWAVRVGEDEAPQVFAQARRAFDAENRGPRSFSDPFGYLQRYRFNEVGMRYLGGASSAVVEYVQAKVKGAEQEGEKLKERAAKEGAKDARTPATGDQAGGQVGGQAGEGGGGRGWLYLLAAAVAAGAAVVLL